MAMTIAARLALVRHRVCWEAHGDAYPTITYQAAIDHLNTIEAHIAHREKIIEAIVKFLSQQIGDCPTSFFGYAKDKKCEVCIGDIPLMMECWKEYFKKQVGEIDGKTD